MLGLRSRDPVYRITGLYGEGGTMKERLERKDVYLYITLTLIGVSLTFTLFRFELSALRVWQSIKDLFWSLVYYCKGYANKHETVFATVTKIPEGMKTQLPLTWKETKILFGDYFELLFSKDNFFAYMDRVGDILYNVAYVIMLLLLPLAGLYICLRITYSVVDNRHGESSAQLEGFLKFEKKATYPMKDFIKGYFAYLFSGKRIYFKILKWIWLWNLNVITMMIGVFAYVFYLPFSMDFENIFVQVAKIAMDSMIAIRFIPGWLWFVIGYMIFDHWRRERGFSKLEANEEDNKEYLLENPENFMMTGEPRVGKTLTSTDMSVSQEVIFREVAQEKSFERHMEFPFFEWGVLEQSIKTMRDKLSNFCLEFIRELFFTFEQHFRGRAIYSPQSQAFTLKKFQNLGYQGKDFIFGYDYEKYGLYFDDMLKNVYLFRSVELYAEEYYIYTSPTPLCVGNYPIRFNIHFDDLGNYPIFEVDYFRKSPKEILKDAQFNHILYYDSMRLGKKKDPTNKYIHNFEVGFATISEIGKERGNQKTNQGKGKDADVCNVFNDLFEMDAKMRSHGTTIDYFTYFRIFSDEQRAMSLLADLREIGSEIKITKKKKPKILIPGFAFEELIYVIANAAMKKFWKFMKQRHGLKTLALYLALKAYAIIHNHYVRVFNQFSSYDVELKKINNAQGETIEDSKKFKYHISTKKARSDVYDTGFFGVVYKERFKRSATGGINQIPQFSTLQPTLDVMASMGSHHYDEVLKNFEVKLYSKAA